MLQAFYWRKLRPQQKKLKNNRAVVTPTYLSRAVIYGRKVFIALA
jgi:hypothetical protein